MFYMEKSTKRELIDFCCSGSSRSLNHPHERDFWEFYLERHWPKKEEKEEEGDDALHFNTYYVSLADVGLVRPGQASAKGIFVWAGPIGPDVPHST